MAQSTRAAGVGDEAVRRASGRGWDRWFAILDRAGAVALPHRDIARLLHERYGLSTWWSQMITVGYEQARGRRRKHERPDGYQVSVTRTVPAPIDAAFAAFAVPRRRSRWLDGSLTLRASAPPDSLRATWADGTRLEVALKPRGADRTQVVVQHGRLANARAAERMKRRWKEALAALAAYLDRRPGHGAVAPQARAGAGRSR